MDFPKRSGWLVGAGFLLGTLGVKALTSTTAKKCYVQGVATGLRAKAAYEGIVEQAKAEVDDIVAEASYLNACAMAPAEAPEDGAEQPKKAPKAGGSKAAK